MKRFAVYILPIIIWCGAIFILSAQTSLPSVAVNNFDKLAHAFVYAIMGALFCRAYLGYGGKPRPAVLLAVFFASAYGASDEVHQMFTPGRTPEVLDWVADTVGAAIGAASWAYVFVRRPGEIAAR